MNDKILIICGIKEGEWALLKALSPDKPEDELRLHLSLVAYNAIIKEMDSLLGKSGPYKACEYKPKEWLVYFCNDEGCPIRLMDDESYERPHPKEYARRKAARQNRKWVIDNIEIEAHMHKNGGAIIA